MAAIEQLAKEYEAARTDPEFTAELADLLTNYAARPTLVSEAKRFGAEFCGGARVLLKREDLAHTGSHKINNVLGQALLARRLGKTELVAETGAGQHGVAAATVAAHLGLGCTVYMGERDMARQELNVFRMELLGATVRRDAQAVRRDVERAFAMFRILAERRHQPAGQLSGGEQQQLAIARALLSRPRLLMLDEPSLGLAPKIVDQIYALLHTIKGDGVTILLVEQNAERVCAVSDRVYVMSGGEFALSGNARDIANDPRFDAAYFGVRMRERAGAF